MMQSVWGKIPAISKFMIRSNTILSVVVMLLNTLVLLHFHDSQLSIVPSVVLLFVYLYFYKTSRSHKSRMLFTYIMFSLLTLAGEDFVISFSKGKALKYGSPSLQTRVPLWLFGAYLNMTVLIWLLDDFGKYTENIVCRKPLFK